VLQILRFKEVITLERENCKKFTCSSFFEGEVYSFSAGEIHNET